MHYIVLYLLVSGKYEGFRYIYNGETVVNEKNKDLILENINVTRNRIVSFEKYMISRSWGLFFVIFGGIIFLYSFLEPLLSYVVIQEYVNVISFSVDSASLFIVLFYWLHIYGETLRFLRFKDNKNTTSNSGRWSTVTLIIILLYIAINILAFYIPDRYRAIVEILVQSSILLVLDFIIISSVKYSLSEIPGMVYAAVISFLFVFITPLIVDFTSILMPFDADLFYYISLAAIVLIWLVAGISMIYRASDYLEVNNGE